MSDFEEKDIYQEEADLIVEDLENDDLEVEENYSEYIKRIKNDLKELKKLEKESKKKEKQAHQKQGASLGTVIAIALIFTFVGILISVAFSLFGNSYLDSILGVDYRPSNNKVEVYNGPPVEIVLENIDNVSSAVYAKASRSVVGIQVVQSSGVIWDKQITILGEGSGVIYSEDGYIITNAHVIENALDDNSRQIMRNYEVRVYIKSDLSEFLVGQLIGYDTVTDLALLKISASGLAPIEFADSDDIMVGEIAIAIGSPGGLEFMNSVSKGIVSGVNRNLAMSSGSSVYDLIQTDAAINPGNSGGALLNSVGKLIGISAVKIVSENYEGMGFAIASNTISDIVEKLMSDGIVTRPLLGVTVNTNYNHTIARENGFPYGAYVFEVSSGSAAHKAGIKENDIITSIAGNDIVDFYELRRELLKHNPGDKIIIKFYRPSTNKIIEVEVTLDKSE